MGSSYNTYSEIVNLITCVVNLVFCEVETTILIKKREFGEKNVYM